MTEHTAYHNDAWIVSLVDYIRGVLAESKVPVVGICFGHQIIGRALGATTRAAPGGWEVSVESVDLSDEGKRIFGHDTLVPIPPSECPNSANPAEPAPNA